MQQSHRMKIFSRFAESVTPLICKEKLELLHERYYIREFKIWEIDAALATNLYFGIITRAKRNMGEKNEFRWVQNQLRLFVWSLCFHTLNLNMDINDMSQSDWQFFSSLFPNKEKILFEYQAANLLKNHNQYKKWVHEEDQLFEELVKRDKYRLRWSDLGKALFIESNRRYFRTAKQCRERWLNHLDPSKLKKYWNESEDFILIEYVKYNGKRWACISKKLDNKRNEHSIKNRFKSLLTKESKQSLKPCSESELVDSIYIKLLRSTSKDEEAHHDSNPQAINQSQDEEHFSSEYQENSVNFHEDMPKAPVGSPQHAYNHRTSKEILANISLNSHREEERVPKNGLGHCQNQVFQLTRLRWAPGARGVEERKERETSNEVQKRVRADLFLQEDPFELLKCYFYKDSK